MARRFTSARTVLVPALMALAFAVPARAQGGSTPWEAWIGCWDLVPRATSAENPARVCVIPGSTASSVEMVSVVGDRVASRQHVNAAGAKVQVARDDCKGFEEVNATGVRVYLRTSLTCGTGARLTNGVMAMSSAGEWLDIQGVAIGRNVGVRAARYRETPAGIPLPAEVTAALHGHPRGMHAARIAAAGRIRAADVVEASRFLEVGVLQTLLAEEGQGFGLDARQLVALEASGVAPSVIDIMVALSYPEVFALDRTRLGDPPPDVRGEERVGFGGDFMDDSGYGYDPYGMGYGRGYGWYPGRQPVVVVRQSGETSTDEHGRVVKGRGYVSGRDDARSGSGRSGGGSTASDKSGSGSGSSTDKGTSTGRKAKPRP